MWLIRKYENIGLFKYPISKLNPLKSFLTKVDFKTNKVMIFKEHRKMVLDKPLPNHSPSHVMKTFCRTLDAMVQQATSND